MPYCCFQDHAAHYLDHGGAPQTLTGSHNGCSFRADLADGCRVTVESEHGCGSLSFQRIGDN